MKIKSRKDTLKKKKILLKDGEFILSILPYIYSGPGGSNRFFAIHIGKSDGTFRTQYVHPDRSDPAFNAFFEQGMILISSFQDIFFITSKKSSKKNKPA